MGDACFELKGSLFTLTVLQLFKNNLSLLAIQLKDRIKMAPEFFNHTPVVIDLYQLGAEQQDMDFFALRELLLSFSIIPVGIKGADKNIHLQLEAAGMAVLAESKTASKQNANGNDTSQSINTSTEDKSIASEPLAEVSIPVIQQPVKIVKRSIRSGQQVYAAHGDLIIVGSVSEGAEILADGNIHIYGVLRGRALAGVRGDENCSIFCRTLQAELLSIAGIYLLSDDILEDKMGSSVQIYLTDEKLQIESI
jgi:septum site-determining protein MinC